MTVFSRARYTQHVSDKDTECTYANVHTMNAMVINTETIGFPVIIAEIGAEIPKCPSWDGTGTKSSKAGRLPYTWYGRHCHYCCHLPDFPTVSTLIHLYICCFRSPIPFWQHPLQTPLYDTWRTSCPLLGRIICHIIYNAVPLLRFMNMLLAFVNGSQCCVLSSWNIYIKTRLFINLFVERINC